MQSIIEEIFYGNISPNTDCRCSNNQTKELMGYIANHHDSLAQSLDEQQKETLEKFNDCFSELNDINEREIFIYAFRLGMRIAMDVLCENKNL